MPVLEPVRARGSSELHYPGGARSGLWRIFERYGVDVYLCGEVHDVTATSTDGIVQLAHGGAFQFGLTTYALLDVHDDRIDVTLRRLRRPGARRARPAGSGRPSRSGLPDLGPGGAASRSRSARSPSTAPARSPGASGILLPYRP